MLMKQTQMELSGSASRKHALPRLNPLPSPLWAPSKKHLTLPSLVCPFRQPHHSQLPHFGKLVSSALLQRPLLLRVSCYHPGSCLPVLPALPSLLSPFSISSFSKELCSPSRHFGDLRQQVPHPPISVLRQGHHQASVDHHPPCCLSQHPALSTPQDSPQATFPSSL